MSRISDRRDVERTDAADSVGRCHGDRRGDPGTGPGERSDAPRNARIPAKDATKQRSPREQDSNLVGDADQLGGRRLGCGRDEQEVGVAATGRGAGGTARRLDHRRGVSVEPNDEGGRFGLGQRERRAAITRTEIDDHPLVASDQPGDLPDVDLDEAASNDRTHAPILPGHDVQLA